jgi:beta-lactam-binding protein with PASTA domain
VATTRVPLALVGRRAAVALREIHAAGLNVSEHDRPSTRYAAGRVVAVSPRAGAEVDRDSFVQLAVSSGPPLVQVPDLTGLTRYAAASQLSHRHLLIAVDGTAASDQPAGTVISQQPTSSEEEQRGTTIHVTLARPFEWHEVWRASGTSATQSPLLKLPQRWRINFSAAKTDPFGSVFISIDVVGSDGLTSDSFQINSAGPGVYEPSVGRGRWAIKVENFGQDRWSVNVQALM